MLDWEVVLPENNVAARLVNPATKRKNESGYCSLQLAKIPVNDLEALSQ